jgi:tetratricopeptide (TPR) repeat protein
VPDVVTIYVAIDEGGATTQIRIRPGNGSSRDEVLERCMEGVVKSLPYVGVGGAVSVEHELRLGNRRFSRPTKCSEASKVSLPVRREIWRARGNFSSEGYQIAAHSCELRSWTDRQAFLELIIDANTEGAWRLRVARDFAEAGDSDAAEFIRHETLREARTFSELQNLVDLLRQDEPVIDEELDQALSKAKSDEQRLELCRKFLRLSPHSSHARERLLALLEALEQREAIVQVVETWRAEPIADAGLLARGASALLRLGLEADGRRAFGELIERAPRDPWTLAFVGDRLRAEGLFNEAGNAYDSLARLLPEDGSVTLRQALAHAGAGRLDVASRLLERVGQTGGRGDDGRLGQLASIAEAVLLSRARGGHDENVESELQRRLLRTPLPDASVVVLVHAPPSDEPVFLEMRREQGETLPQTATLDARELGLSAMQLERGTKGATELILRRKEVTLASHPIVADVSILVLGEPGSLPDLSSRQVEVSADGKSFTVRLANGRFL